MQPTNQMDQAAQRLSRVYCALDGLSTGDALGDRWFFTKQELTTFQPITDRKLPPRPWGYTDDTQMALSIVEILRRHQGIDQDALARSFAKRFERSRGYGPAMYRLIPLLQDVSWRTAASSLFDGQGSYGNGSAMRVAPVGAYFADNLPLVVEHAKRSAEITHAHPEGVAGAIAVAVAAAFAWQNHRDGLRPTRPEFIDQVLRFIPDSEVRSQSKVARDIADPWTSLPGVIGMLGNGSGISAQDTVPFCLWCAGEHLDNYEEAIWLTLSGGGDYDTNCAIVGGIMVMYTGREAIPPLWLQHRERLPSWTFTDLSE